MRRALTAAVILVGISIPTRALADYTFISEPFDTVLSDGTKETHPPSYLLPMPDWDKLDAEVRRLQDAETRLKVENDSLRLSAERTTPPWGVIGTFVVGIALGAYIGYKL